MDLETVPIVPHAPVVAEVGPDDAVRAQLRRLLSQLHPTPRIIDRRAERRYPFPQLILLAPVEANGTSAAADPVVVAGKHLSERGLGFYHPAPLTYRRAIASLELRPAGWIGLLVDLSWCRFTRQGWYESGGRILDIVPPALRLTG